VLFDFYSPKPTSELYWEGDTALEVTHCVSLLIEGFVLKKGLRVNIRLYFKKAYINNTFLFIRILNPISH